jgi:hypothetical protein
VSYSPKTNWKDLPDTSTPILSADLIRIETGIATVDANTTAETARAQAAEAAEATARANSDALFIPLTQKGSTSGVATLDSGTKIPVGQVPDLSATYALVSGTTYVDVDAQRVGGDPDDTAAFQRAINIANASGVKRVLARGRAYTVSYSIDYGGANGLVIEGSGIGETVITANGTSSTIGQVFLAGTAASKVTFRNFTILGDTVDDATSPRRSRTYTANGFNTAIAASGDLVPSSSNPAITDVRIDSVEVIGSRGLPIWLSGVRGTAKITNCRFYNTMDVGWTWCERAVCIGNSSTRSADNGFSLSRGNQSVVCVGNRVDNCAYFGIWVSGFNVTAVSTDQGPTNVVVTGNVVTTAGKGGIHADDAPQFVTITGNTVNGVQRGPSDAPTDLFGCGVFVGGFGSSRTAPTAFAYAINITGNTLVNCARGGVEATGVKHILVASNLIINPGSTYLADGTTLVANNDTNNNFGIAVLTGAQSTTTNLSIRGNVIIDDRGTALCTYAWYTSGSTGFDVQGNRQSGTLQAATLVFDTSADVHSGVHVFQASTKFSGGAVTGSNAGTGTIAGFDTNGAAGSTRPVRWLTGGVECWHLRANTTAEGGSDAGSDLEIVSRTDAGAAKFTLVQFIRNLSITQFTRGTALQRVAQTLSSSGAVTIDASAGDSQAITLQANATSSSITNPTIGQLLTITWTQDATGSRTYVWPANCKFAGGAAPTASTTAAWKDKVRFEYTGSNWEEIARSVGVR